MNRSFRSLIKLNLLEITKDKFFWILVFIGLFLHFLSLVVGELSFSEQTRLIVHFGILASQLCSLAIVCLIAPLSWSRDIDRRSILMILSRPIPRSQYLIAKFMSLLTVSFIILLSLLWLVVFLAPDSLNQFHMMQIFLGLFFESSVLLAFALFSLQFLRPILTSCFTLTLFLAGHWVEEVRLFAVKSGQGLMLFICEVLDWIVPNFYRMNFKSIYFVESGVPAQNLIWSSGHSIAWTMLLLSLGILIFKGRDLV